MDYTPLITSEHSGQPNFVATVALTANAIGDITALIQSLPAAFDLDAAVGSQLDVVGQWVGLSRVVTGILQVGFFGFADDASALGFEELGSPATGGRFIELSDSATGSARLGDPEYRLLLEAKIIANGFDGNTDDYDAALADVIPVPVTTYDPGAYVVLIAPSAALDPVIQALLTGFDILPRPGGVRYQFVFPMASPLAWTTVGTAVGANTQVSKVGGTTAWDASAYIAAPFNHAFISWTVPENTLGKYMVGLAANPSGSPNYPSLNYGLYINQGVLQIYESGVFKGAFGAGYSPGDNFAVYYDGTQGVYLHNGKIIRTSPGVFGSLSPMLCLFTPGSVAQNISIATG